MKNEQKNSNKFRISDMNKYLKTCCFFTSALQPGNIRESSTTCKIVTLIYMFQHRNIYFYHLLLISLCVGGDTC